MKTKLTSIIAALIILVSTSAWSQADQKAATIDMLRHKLTNIKTPKDSLPILYDILDLTSRDRMADLVKEMYGVATRAGETSAQLDLCRQVTAALRDDSHFAEIQKEVNRLPASEEQKETELFIKMKRVAMNVLQSTEAQRQQAITDLITKFESDKKSDKYDQLLDLFTLVEYLRHVATGKLLDKYLGQLFELVNEENFDLYAIPNIIYTETANIYSDAGENAKSVKADRRLLEIIKGLEQRYESNGRKYRNYDITKYVCYRRMLRNYPALGHGEAEELYAKIKALAKSDPDVKKDFETNPRTLGFYYMAVADYNSAIPYLKSMLEGNNSISIRRQVLEALLKATEQTGDDETRLYALAQYKNISEEYDRLKATERYNELQIKYDLKSLKEKNAALELENRTEEADSAKRMMSFLLVAFLILAAAMFVSLFHWSRFRTNVHKMSRIVKSIRQERNKHVEKYYDYNELGKTRAGMELAQKDSKRGDKEIATYMTECILNDLINISLMGGDDRMKYIQKCSVDRVMREAVAKASEKLENPGRIDVEYPESDFSIISDRECLVDILVHLIESMATLGGSLNNIHLSVRHTSHEHTNFIFHSKVNISSARNEAEIFSRPYVTGETMGNTKNGLYICRMISMTLDSSFTLDKTYTEGARYIFSVPDDLTHSIHEILCRKKTTKIEQ